jgi:pectate lyase
MKKNSAPAPSPLTQTPLRWLRSLRSALAAIALGLAPTTITHAQLAWSAYDTSGAIIGTASQAATFDAATESYTFTVPAGQAYTFVTTNFAPIAMTAPASGTTIKTISYKMRSTAGWTGVSAGNRVNNVGLFDTSGTPPGATGNFTDDVGLWANFKGGAWGNEVFGGVSPNNNLIGPYNSTTKLSSGKTAGSDGAWTLVDGELITVTFRTALTSGGSFSIGTSSAYANAGLIVEDTAAVGSGTSFQAIYSGSAAAVTAPRTFNEYAFYFYNTSGTDSTITLSAVTGLTPPPYFTAVTGQPPASLSATVGQNVSIASSIPASFTGATFQWQKSTDSGANYTDIAASGNASATTNTLALTSVQASDSALYRVIVTNAAGSTTSNATELTVGSSVVAPSVLNDPQPATILVGGNNTFSVSANGTTPLTYQWAKSTDSGATYTDIPSANAATYAVTNASLADTGLFRVTATNSAGSATSAGALLSVNEVPAITAQPVGGILNAGDNLTLTATATGTPAPTYQWKLNGVDIASATSASYTITGAASANTGNYTVVVTNTAGSVTSAVASVSVLNAAFTASTFAPVNAATAVLPDARLSITFNQPVLPGVSGFLRIRDAADDSVVDTIDLATATALGNSLRAAKLESTLPLPVQTKSIGGQASFNYYPITVDGSTATLYPRDGVLTYGKTYYVTFDAGVFTDASGGAIAAMTDPNAWRFSTKASAPTLGATITVAADGSGDFATIQGALDFVPAGNSTPRTISIKNGTYFELVYFTGKNFLTLQGENAGQTIVDYPNNNTFNGAGGVYHRGTFYGNNVHDILLTNFTVRNSTPQNGTQAEAIILTGSATTGHNVLSKLKLYSYQDTLQVNGQCYITDCTIEGDVDFMWGNGPSFFNNCDIRILRTAGYFAQVRNPATNRGFVYYNCRFTAPAGISGTFINRIDPAAAQFPYSEVVLINSVVGDATNNALLNTNVGASGANFQAGWWLLNNVTTDVSSTTAANIHFWDANTVDKDGTALKIEGRPAFTVMPSDATTLDHYSSAAWVLGWTPPAPAITTQPATQSVSSGAAVSLTVTATGTAPIAYQWKKDGTDIAAANSATYTIASATSTDAASYTVVVTDAIGSVTSDAAVLTVGSSVISPTITTQPAPQTVNTGAAASFTVAATGTAPFTYQWKKDGTDIAAATSDTYSIAAAANSDAGSYTVVVTNAAGSATSTAAALIVNAPTSTPTTLVEDSFADGITTVQDLAHNSVAIYKSRSGTTRTEAPGSVTFTQTATGTSSESHWFHFTDSGSPLVLQVGDSVTVNISFSFTGLNVAASNNTFRFGIFDSLGSRAAADVTGGQSDNGTPEFQGDLGYIAALETLGGAGAPFSNLGRRDVLTSGNIFGTFNDFTPLTDITATDPRVPLVSNAPYTVSMTVKRQTDASNVITLSASDGSSTAYTLTATDAGAATTTHAFDWFGIRYPGTNIATAITITNVKVVYTPAATSVAAPAITAQPSFTGGATSLASTVGASTALSVSATGTGLSYQWKKDGTDVAGATSATLNFASLAGTDAGSYTVVVTNAGGTVTSAAASLSINGTGGLSSPDGFAASVTGGAAGATVTVTNAADLSTYARSSTAYDIIVSGTIDLGDPDAGQGRITVTSNKTLRGADTSATIKGTINISNANNVIVRNLNITQPLGNTTGTPQGYDCVTVAASTNVLVTKCSIYDATDGNLDVINGSDLVTVSWCKFYYIRTTGHRFSNLIGSSDTDTGSGNGLTNYRVTWHHNWWAEGCDQRMLACRFGGAHMFNNYWSCAGNSYCTEVRLNAEMLSEYNVYDGVKDPLAKRDALPTDLGKLKTINNVFNLCTGSQLVSNDTVFTPPYSYQMTAVGDVPALVQSGAGNVSVDAPVASTATITGADSIPVGGSVTLTAVANGFTPASYQWRFKNEALSGATSATLTLNNGQSADTGDYTVELGLSAGGIVVSAPHTLTLGAAATLPVITTQPASLTVSIGSAASLNVTATGSGLSYQWKNGTSDIPGATNATYAIASSALKDAGSYTVVVTNSAGSVTSTAATLTVAPAFAAPAPNGYAASVTGGGSAQQFVATTAADFRTQAESSSAAIITVSGTLNLGATKVAVKSNKTIQGIDASATLIGNLELASGVTNVVIRGVNITNPGTTISGTAYTDGGDGITLTGATGVFINHVTFFDCADTLLRIVSGADNVTVSWCEFYYTAGQTVHRNATLIGVSGETKPLHVTLDHNAWSDRVDQQMPTSTYGQVHLFNNYFNPGATPNTSGSAAVSNAQFLSERNQYTGVVSPLTKAGGSLVRTIGNVYTSTSGTAADAGADAVFFPTYSYHMQATADLPALLQAGAGNTAGGASATLANATASINASATSVTAGSSFNLTATTSLSGANSYQWRLNHADIAGATSATYTVSSAQTANAGTYTVACSNADGETTVSTPVSIDVTAAPETPAPAKSGHGGGAPSFWFLGALALLAAARRKSKRA